MHIEIFVFDMLDGTLGINNLPVPEEKKKEINKRDSNCLVLREQLQFNKVKCVIMIETLRSTKTLSPKWCLV